MSNTSDTGAQIALSEPTFFILLSLAPARKHGYAIMKDVDALSEGRVVLSTSTLYTALKRLLELGWIERVADAANATDRERKAYALTKIGRRALETETARLRGLLAVAQRRAVKARS